MTRGGFHWEKNGKHHRQMKNKNPVGMNICESGAGRNWKTKDRKLGIGRITQEEKDLDRERRKKKSQMSRES